MRKAKSNPSTESSGGGLATAAIEPRRRAKKAASGAAAEASRIAVEAETSDALIETDLPPPASDEAPTSASTPTKYAAKSPEDALRRALGAATPRSRGLWARRGLAWRGPLDRTTQAMLLRQLYLAHFEERRFDKARDLAEQIVAIGVLPDVAHQDAARAKQALGDVDGAAAHLRLAARLSPPHRRAFHFWTLGSLLFLAKRYEEARSALTRAARWGTTDKPLYQGHLALIDCAEGHDVPNLPALIDRLAAVPAGQGYGRFVLGQMAFHQKRWRDARKHLEAFVRRSTSGRVALAIALHGEIAVAEETLASLPVE